MQYEPLIYSDIVKLRHLQPEDWPDITDAFRFYCNSDYCNPIKVSHGSEIVGIGNALFFEETAWLDHIIVCAQQRRKGIGNGIVDTLLEEIDSRGIKTTLLISTEIGESVYSKAGFRKVSDYCYFKRDTNIVSKQFISKIQPYKNEFYKDIVHLDAFVSGEIREWRIKNYLNNSYVYIVDKLIEGFYLPDLGEGPIFAITEIAGKELMRFKYRTKDKATIPNNNKIGIDFLKELGFKETNTIGKRMILGQDINWKPEMVYCRVGGTIG